jgi:hypothetical protein
LRKPEGLLIPEIIPVIKAKKAKNTGPYGLRVQRFFRNVFTDATGGRLASGDKDIHGQKNPHECGGTRPAYIFVLKYCYLFVCANV